MNLWTILLILMVGVLLCWTLAPRLYARYRDWHHDRYEHEHPHFWEHWRKSLPDQMLSNQNPTFEDQEDVEWKIGDTTRCVHCKTPIEAKHMWMSEDDFFWVHLKTNKIHCYPEQLLSFSAEPSKGWIDGRK